VMELDQISQFSRGSMQINVPGARNEVVPQSVLHRSSSVFKTFERPAIDRYVRSVHDVGDRKHPELTEITKDDMTVRIEQDVLRFEIAVRLHNSRDRQLLHRYQAYENCHRTDKQSLSRASIREPKRSLPDKIAPDSLRTSLRPSVDAGIALLLQKHTW